MSSLEQLRIIYRQGLAQDIRLLEQARTALPSADAQDALRWIAHRLRGSGASYGFPEISEAARACEQAAAEHLSARAAELLVVLGAHVLEEEEEGA